MYKNSLYEQRSIPDRIRELAILALFTVLVALVSLVVMDLIIFPLSYFAVTHKKIFNFIITDVSIFLFLMVLIFIAARKIYSLGRDGLSGEEIGGYILKRIVYVIVIGIILLVLTVLIVVFLYLILALNNNLLIRMTNG